ncbi:MAG TPA: hypothetical protein VHX86_03065 [Tepidisphaeraceae bacterium]|nr:hypothetical protein [Tepidisphaeraceae bacterium]
MGQFEITEPGRVAPVWADTAQLCETINLTHYPIFGYNPMIVEDLTDQFLLRDRLRRKLAQRKTPAQRMRDMAQLQRRMWATLRRSPHGYEHFLRRNFKARAIPIRDLDA